MNRAYRVKRQQLFEIEDQPWCPASLRDASTRYLQFAQQLTHPYALIVPRLLRALERCHTQAIVDLGAGAGGPWPRLLPALGLHVPELRVALTDAYPNHAAFAELQRQFPRQVAPVDAPVDAARVPQDLRGFRTLFNAFHHFPPRAASAILADAVRQRQGIGVFEATAQQPAAMLGMLLTPPLVALSAVVMRPAYWPALLWTFVLPLLPALVLFDGVVSCLRTYTPDELRALLADVPQADTYTWEIGTEQAPRQAVPVTYLIGCPADTR